MPGQQPWQAPDGRWYSSGQGPLPTGPSTSTDRPWLPNQEKPEKKSRWVAFREWISATAGVTAAVVALVGLLAGGTVVTVKILTPSPKPSPNPPSNITPTSPNSTPPNQANPYSTAQLQASLLSSGTIGSAAIVQSTGTDLSQIGEICGGPVSGDTATAFETIEDQQTGTILDEELVSWQSAADAGQAITDNRQAVDQRGSCPFTSSGTTATYTGDNPGSPPSSCVHPGQYFSTVVSISFSSSTFPEPPDSGYVTEAQCGATTIWVRVYGAFGSGITQQTADGYLSSAIGKLDSTNS